MSAKGIILSLEYMSAKDSRKKLKPCFFRLQICVLKKNVWYDALEIIF